MSVLSTRNDPTVRSGYLDMLTDEECERLQVMADKNDMKLKPTVPSQEQAGMFRNARARWEAHREGNAYVLHLNPLHYQRANPYRVQAYGDTPEDAVARYFRGLEDTSPKQLRVTEVVAVYDCVDEQAGEEGELLL